MASSGFMFYMTIQGVTYHGCKTMGLPMNYFLENYFPMYYSALGILQFSLGFFMLAFWCFFNTITKSPSSASNMRNDDVNIAILGPNPDGFMDGKNQVTFATVTIVNEKRMNIKNI